MKRTGILSIALASAVTVACGGNNSAENRATEVARDTQSSTAATADAVRNTVSNGDKGFVQDMMVGGDAEVQLSKLALERGSSAEVKRYAQMLIQDHTKAGDQLKQIASQHAVQQDAEAGDADDHKETLERLSALRGAEFDREFMKVMVDNHENMVDKLESRVDTNNASAGGGHGASGTNDAGASRPTAGATGTTGTAANNNMAAANVQAKKADNPVEASINQWAANTFTAVNHHLAEAKQLHERLDRGNNRTSANDRNNTNRNTNTNNTQR